MGALLGNDFFFDKRHSGWLVAIVVDKTSDNVVVRVLSSGHASYYQNFSYNDFTIPCLSYLSKH